MKLSDTKKVKISFFSVLFTYFIDNLGWSIVFPIFAPLFLDSENLIFTQATSIGTRTLLLGVFLGAFPFAQFIGAPLLGEFADKKGRKKALILSIALIFLGYIFSAWSIRVQNLYFLFFSRIMTGLFSGNLSICLASIADLSKEEKVRIKNFGYLSILAGAAFIVGPFIGGKFSDVSVSHYFTLDLPLWIAAFLSLLNFLFIIFFFKETGRLHPDVKYNFFESFSHIYNALKIKDLKILYFIYFLLIFALTMVLQFSLVLVIEKFSFSHSQIGALAGVMGICWVIGSGLVSKLLIAKASSIKVLEFMLLFFMILSAIIGVLDFSLSVLIVLGCCVMIGGVAWPVCTSIISGRVSERKQGKILGMSQSMQSIAMAFSSFVGGYAAQYFIELPFVIASFASLLGLLFYIRKRI